MSEFISTTDAMESGSVVDQKAIREEVSAIAYRVRREMDAGLSPDDMKQAQGAKAAAEAAGEILSKIF